MNSTELKKTNMPNLLNSTYIDKKYLSADLFGNRNAISIDHRGVFYTLRITRFGKLILTK